MAKMMKPEVKAVRFGSADVIATSALGTGNKYITKGTEFSDALGNNNYDGIAFIVFSYNKNNIEDGIYQYDSSDLVNSIDYARSSIYAWYDYNGNSWKTEGNPWYSYYNSGEFPTGSNRP